MVKRIDALTPEQAAQMGAWAQRWIDIGLSTEPMDLPRFERAVRAAYELSGLDQPVVVVPVPSPLHLALAAPMAARIIEEIERSGKRPRSATVRDTVRATVRATVDDTVDDTVGATVGATVRATVDDTVRATVDDTVRATVDDTVDDTVGATVDDTVDDTVGATVDDTVDALGPSVLRDTILRYWAYVIGGQFWVGRGWWWRGGPACVSFFQDVCGLELPDHIARAARAYQETAASACWWWPHRRFVMVSDRPMVIRRDERGRLHCEDGPAVAWQDGFSVYAWHGVRVEKEVILTPVDRLTRDFVLGHPNAEVRRVLMERIGTATEVFTRFDGEEVGRDDWGSLVRIERRGDTPYVGVRVLNSTPEPDGSIREYVLRVPPEFADKRRKTVVLTTAQAHGGRSIEVPRTPHAAVAWTFGLTPDEYVPAVMS